MAACRRTGGFTLLELLLVLAIIGVAAALAAPSITAGLEGLRARSAVRTLKAGLEDARIRAVRDRAVHYAVYTGGVLAIRDGIGTVKEVALPQGNGEVRRAEAAFYPAGTSSPAEFDVQYGEAAYRLVLDGSGRLKVEAAGE
ncbi:MAG: prepilin-type N-terminal cleavage/methylation domain-containing protein [Deltaproteobacteria bacterium]|nr:prepilin-type N-terminal cleavage/methylation domain-containing protein [Deltaproteobacteria bacterium]MCL4874261.1 prepilin-type N-terminal cleavage/methylation domain-containing protein [bacterium]